MRRGDGAAVQQAEIGQLTHLNDQGEARMVDVSAKDVTSRQASATGRVEVSAEVIALLRSGEVPKGDALGVSRVAGILGAKATPLLIPLCHPITITGVDLELEVSENGVDIRASVRTWDRTGVEMEALTAVAVAALALVDMVKGVDPSAVITAVQVETKSGGKTGEWRR